MLFLCLLSRQRICLLVFINVLDTVLGADFDADLRNRLNAYIPFPSF